MLSEKEAQPEEDSSVVARLQRLKEDYERWGMRHTVEGLILCHVRSVVPSASFLFLHN